MRLPVNLNTRNGQVIMEWLTQNSLFEYPPGTVEAIRKCWGLDKPGQMKEAVAILDMWAKKQPHFIITDFDLIFLENMITGSKGSLERAKSRLDKYCTLKTLSPKYYKEFDYDKEVKEYRSRQDMALMPKFTYSYNRLVITRYNEIIEPKAVFSIITYTLFVMEYIKKYDCNNGLVLIFDFRSVELFSFFKNLDFVELREIFIILIEGYGIRIGGIHYITESKVIEMMINLMKQIVKPSVSSRIKVHKNLESLYDCVDKDILPADYGGKEKTIAKLHDDLVDAVRSKLEYIDKTRKFGTNEKLRPKDQFNESYIGMPGTFRKLNVD